MMKRFTILLTVVLSGVVLTGCKQKKQTDDIIVKKVETPKPQAPIKMQDYRQVKDIIWLDNDYQIDIQRVPDDSLKMVKDENGQKFVDNRITVSILRGDGSVFFRKVFTKSAFEEYLDDDYRRTGILEGIVFDRLEGDNVLFAGSVCHPQTDEYIPLVLSVSRMGDLLIQRDTDMDTSGNEMLDDQ